MIDEDLDVSSCRRSICRDEKQRDIPRNSETRRGHVDTLHTWHCPWRQRFVQVQVCCQVFESCKLDDSYFFGYPVFDIRTSLIADSSLSLTDSIFDLQTLGGQKTCIPAADPKSSNVLPDVSYLSQSHRDLSLPSSAPNCLSCLSRFGRRSSTGSDLRDTSLWHAL